MIFQKIFFIFVKVVKISIEKSTSPFNTTLILFVYTTDQASKFNLLTFLKENSFLNAQTKKNQRM